MTDICDVSAFVWLVIFILVIVAILSEPSTDGTHDSASQEKIRDISIKARYEAQNLSEEFLRIARDLLKEKRR